MRLGLGLGIDKRRLIASGGGGGFDIDYQAVLDYATLQGYTLASSEQQALQNQLLIDLKIAGVWSKLDSFTLFASDGDSDFALIDWIRLTTITAINSPTKVENQGFYGDAASAYIDSGIDLSAATNYKQDDATMCVGHFTCNGGSNNRLIGSDNSNNFYGARMDVVNSADSNNRWWFQSGSDASPLYIYNAASNYIATRRSNLIYMFSAYRYSDNDNQTFNNNLYSSSALISANYTILRDRTNYSNNETTVSHAFIGSQLSNTEIANTHSAFASYYNNL